MKKVLFVVQKFFPFENAATNAAMPFITEISKHANVDILCENTNNKAKLEDVYNEFCVYRYRNYSLKPLMNYIYIAGTTKVLDKNNSLHQLIRNIIIVLLKIIYLLIRFFDSKNEYRILKKILKNNSYDVVVSVSAPMVTHSLVSDMYNSRLWKKKRRRWFAFIQDPFAEYIENVHKRDYYRRVEKKIYKNTDKLFVFSDIIRDGKDIACSFTDKLISTNMAALIFREKEELKIDFDKNKINCIYIGSLQSLKIRNPEYLYRVISGCNEKIHIYFIVNIWDAENIELQKKYNIRNATNITVLPRQPLNECLAAMQNADILINLGNLASNQLPSKVIDYISSLRPIINFSGIKDCSSKKILENHPVCLNFDEYENNIQEDINKFNDFCIRNKDTIITEDTIRRIYSEFLPENATKAMVDEILAE